MNLIREFAIAHRDLVLRVLRAMVWLGIGGMVGTGVTWKILETPPPGM